MKRDPGIDCVIVLLPKLHITYTDYYCLTGSFIVAYLLVKLIITATVQFPYNIVCY